MSYLLLRRYEIVEARDGGFIVTTDPNPGYTNQILFAGPLDDCLGYIRKALASPAALVTGEPS